MTKISASVIKDSLYSNTRLITLELQYPKFIQAQLNTSRQLAKNAASARAQPSDKFVEHIFVPTKVGINKSGMSADTYLEGDTLASFQQDWLTLLDLMVDNVQELKNKYGVHKQLLNRLLEPWVMTKGIFTGTEESWRHMLSLRLHSDAQPEIHELAKHIQAAIGVSIPQVLEYGQWHLPYVDAVEAGTDNVNIKVSASCIAQVSYRKQDSSLEKALAIFDKLHLLSTDPANPPHISPAQHVCKAMSVDDMDDWTFDAFYNGGKSYFAEMGEFVQCSKYIENNGALDCDFSGE